MSAVSKAMYKPLSLATSVLGGILAGAVFQQVWKRIGDDKNAPEPKDLSRSSKEVLIAAACREPSSLLCEPQWIVRGQRATGPLLTKILGRNARFGSSSVDDGRDCLDLDQLIVVTENGHTHQSARGVVITERVADYLPRRNQVA